MLTIKVFLENRNKKYLKHTIARSLRRKILEKDSSTFGKNFSEGIKKIVSTMTQLQARTKAEGRKEEKGENVAETEGKTSQNHIELSQSPIEFCFMSESKPQ